MFLPARISASPEWMNVPASSEITSVITNTLFMAVKGFFWLKWVKKMEIFIVEPSFCIFKGRPCNAILHLMENFTLDYTNSSRMA